MYKLIKLIPINAQQKNPGNLEVPGYLIFFMVFSPKYSEKRLICTMYFYLPDFLAPDTLVEKILFHG